MNRSQKAARYGALAERWAFDRYGLDVDHTSWNDARDDDGRPWDVKACLLSRRAARFRLWEEPHSRLRREDGGYVFVGYVLTGRGIRVRQSRTLRARDLSVSFYGAGAHQKGNQVKIRPGTLF